jgi:hypothetical protein
VVRGEEGPSLEPLSCIKFRISDAVRSRETKKLKSLPDSTLISLLYKQGAGATTSSRDDAQRRLRAACVENAAAEYLTTGASTAAALW